MESEGETPDLYLVESLWDRFAVSWNEFWHGRQRTVARQSRTAVRRRTAPLRKVKKREWSKKAASGWSNERLLRCILGGMVFGLVLYFLMVTKLRQRVSIEKCGFIAANIGFVFFFALLYSKRVRASASLTLCGIFGDPMQDLLILFLFSAVLETAGRSALSNLEISIEMALCIKDKVGEQLAAIAEEMLRPLEYIHDRIAEIRAVIDETLALMQQLVFSLKQATQVVLQMLTGAIRFLDNVVFTCDTTAEPTVQCWSLVNDWVAKCYQNQLTWAKFYMVFGCALIYWLYFICILMRAEIGAICTIGSIVKSQLREQIVNRLIPSISNVASSIAAELYVDVGLGRQHSYNQTVSHQFPELFAAIRNKFGDWEIGFGVVIELTHWFPFILLLWTIISSFRYVSNFKSFLPFDNNYETAELQVIDQQRVLDKLESVFPLDPFGQRKERRKCMKIWVPWPHRSEWPQLANNFVMLMVKLAPIGIVLLAARFLHSLVGTMTDAMSEAADAGTGGVSPHYSVNVEGRGFMAQIFRSLLDTISFGGGQRDINETDEWRECLVGSEPQFISDDEYNIMLGMLVVIIALCYVSMFQRRFRHRIVGYFYPDAAESRAAWKVGEILMIRQQVRLQGSRFSLEHLQQGPKHLLANFRNMAPMATRVADCYFGKVVNCIRCGCGGENTDADNFRSCINERCGVHYCYFCFDQLPKHCCARCGCKILQLSATIGDERFFHWQNDPDDEQFMKLKPEDFQKEQEQKKKKQRPQETYDFAEYLDDLKIAQRKTADERQRIIQRFSLLTEDAQNAQQDTAESQL